MKKASELTRKPRHNPDKRQNRKGKFCSYFENDRGCNECGRPYRCDGNPHNCFKHYMKWLSTLPKQKREEVIKKERERNALRDAVHYEMEIKREIYRIQMQGLI